MDRGEFLDLMQFPREWIEWDMVPDEYLSQALALYKPGHEAASEHDRHGVFQWWLRQAATPEQLVKLARLTWLDPDPPMAGSVRAAIAAHPSFSPAVDDAIRCPYRAGVA